MENKLKFLVIDDNEIDRLVTGQLLKIHLKTVNVHYAGTGEDGIEWLKENNEGADYMLFILLDISMPEMDGLKFLEAIEKLDDQLKKNINVFMLSSTLNSDE
ncbi:MAG TPA: response regulator, partial [Chitinophagaceae bacterium]|nr:response regulator [Chitinophagaceae bacterium]